MGSSQPQPRGRRQGPQGGGRGRNRQRQNRQFVGPMDHSYRGVQPGNESGYEQNRFRRPVNGNGYAPALPQEPAFTPQPSDAPARIFCFIEDLFFFAKINEVARQLGIKVEFVKSAEPVLERAEESVPENERPSLVMIDLNNANAKPLALIPKLRAKLKKSASIIGFVSHIQGDLKLKAQEAGCDMVVPRSAFSQNLPSLLRRHASVGQDHEA
jgi:CheY-like chemotaxis protein